ncbi:hypothetical protein ACJMK2_039777 [Sinanodonta woodiana]|uniref:GDP-fucose protein O-fucosyltransferase 1 n=1 Tax=Sinanodonta woodiana TaxID=1069815 RepID=A0ABD3WD17_SINWO
MMAVEFLILVLASCMMSVLSMLEVDPNGYILYCPCMGRFGNQADQFLGSLGFAKALNRTLVLPHWIEYPSMKPGSIQVPYDKYFKVEPLKEYHRVMTMKIFMEELAPKVWPPGERIAFCYQGRSGGSKKDDCNAKEGNPFGPFWNHFNVDFDKSAFYTPLYFDSKNQNEMIRWTDRFPANKFPVLAFTGAPGPFPVQAHHRSLQRYMQWSDEIEEEAQHFISNTMQDQPFLGIHLRLGSDFQNACRHVKDSPLLFAAAQCLGYRNEHGRASMEMCYQSDETIIRDVKKQLDQSGITKVFIATDSKDLIGKLSSTFEEVKFVKYDPPYPHVEMAILGKADYFIGNCISTFTAFVKRERDVHNKPTAFWDFPPQKHDEF